MTASPPIIDADRNIARRALVQGRVQGVWFRGWAVKSARALGLVGWVRNRRDGAVDAHLQGSPEAVEAMAARLWEGPPAAHVTHVALSEAEPIASTRFEEAPNA